MEYPVCHERGTKKKSESPTGIEPMTSRTPVGRSNHWAMGRLVASEVIFTEFVVTRVLLHTARPELSKYDLARHESPRSSVIRAPDRCMGGHGFFSIFFFCYFLSRILSRYLAGETTYLAGETTEALKGIHSSLWVQIWFITRSKHLRNDFLCHADLILIFR